MSSKFRVAPPQPPAVLIVDDDEDLALAIKVTIRDAGYRAVWARNGREALAAIRHEVPALMLVDILMPVMDGAEFLATVDGVASLADIPRLILTGAHERGVDDGLPLLNKPVDLEAVMAFVRQYAQPELNSA